MTDMIPKREALILKREAFILKREALAGANSGGEAGKQHGLVGHLAMRLDVKTMRSKS
jgi:hypothetical protein